MKPFAKKTTILFAAAGVLLVAASAWAAVQPNPLFSDGAVLQRGIDVPVWGTASDGEKITVTIRKQTLSTIARDGKWMVKLRPLRAGGPFTMKINDIQIKNVLVGEVWICSGQSNMEFSLNAAANGAEAVGASADPMLRLYHVDHKISKTPLDSAPATWQESSPATSASFSAVGYFFARELRKNLNVPVGMIESSWGGTVAETWASRDGLLSKPDFRQMLVDSDKTPIDGNPNRACLLYDGMIAPLRPYAIRGAIWYQGESNAGRAREYRTLFPTMIRSWREAWGQGDFPFLFVQLAPFGKIVTEPQESGWAELREAQLLTTHTCPNTAMAVITDLGNPDDIHPKQKEPVGQRLALAADAIAYDKRVVYRGPLFDSMTLKSGRAIVSFGCVDGGLVAKDGDLKGFTIAGADGKFYNAQAKIVGKRTVEVTSALAPHPVSVRYGWADCPVVNLCNKMGLPASPFRTDSK